MRRLPALFPAFLAVAAAASAGCGAGGAAGGATVSVYVAAPLCKEAQRGGGTAGDLELRVVCLPPSRKGKVDLAAIGGAARRATEDSTAVAFLEVPGPAAEFSRSIVEAADVAWLETSSASAAMRHIRRALEGDASSPRKAVLDEVR